MFCQDGIVIAVNNKNSVSGLSKNVKRYFFGKISNWKEVGRVDTKINLLTREEGFGTLDVFISIVMIKD